MDNNECVVNSDSIVNRETRRHLFRGSFYSKRFRNKISESFENVQPWSHRVYKISLRESYIPMAIMGNIDFIDLYFGAGPLQRIRRRLFCRNGASRAARWWLVFYLGWRRANPHTSSKRNKWKCFKRKHFHRNKSAGTAADSQCGGWVAENVAYSSICCGTEINENTEHRQTNKFRGHAHFRSHILSFGFGVRSV